MDGKEWEAAKGEVYIVFKELVKLVPGYGYSDEANSVKTDELVCSLIIGELDSAKGKLFEMLQLLYEMQDEGVSRLFQSLKDALDILSDEIKVRYCKWKEIGREWLKKIVRHDRELVQGAKKLNTILEGMYKMIIKEKKVRIEGELKYNPELWGRLKGGAAEVEKEIDNLVMAFKEREAICNIEPVSLNEAYEKIRDEIREKL